MTDRPPLESVFREHAPTIYRLGLRVCPSPESAEDLVQETFLRATQAWDQFDGRSKPSTWLWTIAARACQRMTRKRAGEPERLASLEEILPAPGDDVPEIPDPRQPDALSELEAAEVQRSVEAAIAELPEGFRLPLVLRDIADLSPDEIAHILEIPAATVRTRVHRARILLRNALVSNFPRQPAPAAPSPEHREICLDLLHTKMMALDRGAPFEVPNEELCLRCRSMFAGLDLAQDACQNLRRGDLPESLARLLDERFSEEKSP